MRNYIKILLLIMVLAISGCGSGATSADPLGTDTISVIAAPTSLGAGESSVITATVKHADGTAATLRSVSFSIAPNNSGGTITVTNDGRDNGIATAIYTAGTNTPTISVQDTVKAIIENGATAVVFITRTGSATPPLPASAILTLTPSSLTPLTAGQNNTITANVTDSAGAPLSGVTVTFSLPVTGSGSPTLSALSAVTDSSGNAITIYSPGTASPTTSVSDVVQASLANNSTKLVTITRLGTAAVAPLSNVISTLTASLTPLIAGQYSTITANVKDTAGTALSGVTVTFSLPVKNSGTPTLSATTAITDSSGNAITIYLPGTGTPTMTVDDVVQASLVNGSTKLVTITRTAGAAATGTYAVSVSPSPASVTAGQVSIVTATVTVTSGSATVSGVTVDFTLPVALNQSGATLSSATATTDSSGKAVVIYKPGITNSTLTVQDTVQAAIGTATDAKAITRTGSSTSAFSISLGTPAPATVPVTGGSSVITANVTNNLGTAVSGVTVNFVQTGGTSVLPAAPITDGSGNAVTVFTGPGGVAGTQAGVVTASITIDVNTYTAAVVILY